MDEERAEVKLLYVEFWDHCSDPQGWHDPDTLDRDPTYIKTSGYLTKETDTYIHLAQNLSTSGNIANGITILKSCIKKRKVIKL